MADAKFSALANLTGSGVAKTADLIPIVDVSASVGKNITPDELLRTPGLTFVGPHLGTPADGNLANCTGLPVATGLSGIGGTPSGSKFLRDDFIWTVLPGGGDALIANPLSQFASTTSAQLRSVLADETGTGLAYFQHGNLGTPSGGVLINCTGFDLANAVGALGVDTNPQTGTTYTVLTGDKGIVIVATNAAAMTYTLPDAGSTGFPDQWLTTIKNEGAGVLTVNRTSTSLIDNGTNKVIYPGQSYSFISNATDWKTVAGAVSLNILTVPFPVAIGDGVNNITVDTYSFGVVCPYTGTITGWNIWVDGGTCTVKWCKKAAGTAGPTISDSINTSGVSIPTGTVIESTTLSDFTSVAVTAGDIIRGRATAVGGSVKAIVMGLVIRKSAL